MTSALPDRSARGRALLGLALAGLLALSLPASAAEEPLVTDRPDQTESAEVVPKGTLQLEAGWTFTRDDEGAAWLEQHEIPQTLLRVGVSRRIELRFGWDGYATSEIESPAGRVDHDGVGDASLGLKALLRPATGREPQIALLAGTTLPVGDDEVTSDEADPELRLALAHDLTDRLSLGYNVGVARESEPGEGSRELAFGTVALGIGLGDRTGMFLELFGDTPLDSGDGDGAISFDAGVTYLLRETVQLDLAAGRRLGGAAPDWFLGVGLSWRWPR